MTRATNAISHRDRHKKILDQAEGYRGMRSRSWKSARDAVRKALQYAYRGRKEKKRNFRKLWISRINAAARQNGTNYSQFIHGLRESDIDLNRKTLAHLAVNRPEVFEEIVEEVE